MMDAFTPRSLNNSSLLGISLLKGGGVKSTLIGKGFTMVVCPIRVTENRSQFTRHSRVLSTVSRKLLQWNWVWKPIMSAPNIPWSISRLHGHMLKASGFGHGMCQKRAIFALGCLSFMILGSMAK